MYQLWQKFVIETSSIEFASSDYRAALPEVPTPTLLLQNPDDPAVPPAVGHYLARALPHATLGEIEAYGHFPQMSAPDVVNAAIRAYLDS